MPVVRRGNAHCINIFAGDDFLEIDIGFAIGRTLVRETGVIVIDFLEGIFTTCSVHIADCDDLTTGKEAVQQAPALLTHADKAYCDAIIGFSLGRPDRGWKYHRRDSRGFQKRPA